MTTGNRLFYGDNLDILREHVASASVDLVYLDPPFNSNRNYNVLFRDESGIESESQIQAFQDTWHWDTEAEKTYHYLIRHASPAVSSMIGALRQFVGSNQMMAYLVMMAARLVELHRVLKPTGSLWLHCDSTASHYLKVVLDTIFGVSNYRNEVVWKRASTVKGNFGQGSKRFDNNTDIIFFYTKTEQYTFHTAFTEYSDEYIKKFYKHVEPNTGRRYQLISMIGPGGASKGNPIYEVMGVTRYWRYSKEKMQSLMDAGMVVQVKPGSVPRRKLYLDEGKGVAVQTLWDDIEALSANALERLGYPTQKPLALLERIIEASSNPGDIVLDPFCGCGTTIAAAEKLGRNWVGIDITFLSIALQRYRLADMFGAKLRPFEVVGVPESVAAAKYLANEDRYQFQWWALSLIDAKPIGGEPDSKQGKKGADKGIDGVIRFIDDASGKPKTVIVQVKSGKVQRKDMGELRGTVDREGAAIGVFVTLEEPTANMRTEAVQGGYYSSPGWGKDYPRLQILTIRELLEGATVQMPPPYGTFQAAPKVRRDSGKQIGMDL